MKKYILILLLIMLPVRAYALKGDEISAECACVVEMKTGKTIFAKNENAKHAMASTTKIMTALIALENSTGDEMVQISENAAKTEGSSTYIEAGEKVYMKDLIYGLMLNSGNDAAVAIAEHISGGTEEFCKLMNKKAAEIGAKNTHFKNPNGLFEEGHYTTASDLAQITRCAMENTDFREIVATKAKTVTLPESGKEVYFGNHNKLLWNYEGAVGVKTGYTKDTGRCLVSAAEKGGALIIAVTLDAPNDWGDHKALLDFGFESLENRLIIAKNQVLKSIEINGIPRDFVAEDDCILSFEHGNEKGAVVNVKVPSEISGNVQKGEKVGEAEVFVDGVKADTVNIISASDIIAEENKIINKKDGFFTRLIDKFLGFFLN